MPRLIRALFFAAVIAISIPLHASTVLKMTVTELVAHSDRVVIGSVIETTVFEKEGRILTSVTVAVEETLVGEHSPTVEIVHYGGRYHDRVTYVPGMPTFTKGEHVLLFLEKPKLAETAQHFVVTGMSQGKFWIVDAPDGKTPYVVPTLGGVSLVLKRDDKLTTALPSTDHRMAQSLDEMKSKIEGSSPK